MNISSLIGLTMVLVLIIAIAWWLRKSIWTIGSARMPSEAVKLRFGKVVGSRGPGLAFALYPIETFRIFPTTLYRLRFEVVSVHSKKKPPYETTTMRVFMSVYFRWPLVGETYKFQDEEISGGELLEKTHYALPIDPVHPNGTLLDFFSDTIADACRRVMTSRTHVQCREEKEQMEKEIKDYLLSEPGNPFRECRIPEKNLDVSITQIDFPEDFEKALYAPEVAVQEREAISQRIRAFTTAGVNAEVAAFAVVGLKEGEKFSLSQLRDLAIFRFLSAL